jgi:hypothetical protein
MKALDALSSLPDHKIRICIGEASNHSSPISPVYSGLLIKNRAGKLANKQGEQTNETIPPATLSAMSRNLGRQLHSHGLATMDASCILTFPE